MHLVLRHLSRAFALVLFVALAAGCVSGERTRSSDVSAAGNLDAWCHHLTEGFLASLESVVPSGEDPLEWDDVVATLAVTAEQAELAAEVAPADIRAATEASAASSAATVEQLRAATPTPEQLARFSELADVGAVLQEVGVFVDPTAEDRSQVLADYMEANCPGWGAGEAPLIPPDILPNLRADGHVFLEGIAGWGDFDTEDLEFRDAIVRWSQPTPEDALELISRGQRFCATVAGTNDVDAALDAVEHSDPLDGEDMFNLAFLVGDAAVQDGSLCPEFLDLWNED